MTSETTLSVCADPHVGKLSAHLQPQLVDGQLVVSKAELLRLRSEASAEIGTYARGPIVAIPVAVTP